MKIYYTIAIILIIIFETNAQPNCSSPSTGFIPINDLGTGISPVTGLMGGLYPNGSNFIPSAHKSVGLLMASQVQCLDLNGNPDAVNGKIVWLSIGMSNCTQETQQFMPLANAFSGKNPKLTFVDGAQGGQTAQIIASPWNSGYANFWTTVGARLYKEGVTANQVQVIWLKEANQVGATPVQTYYDSLVVQLKRIAKELKIRFPNVKLCYMASRISARYATTTLNPEPHSYWTGWAVKKVIEDQINGDVQLTYSGSSAKSPWLAWGIYMWSDGSTPQATNPDIYFTCPTDYQNDGTHPSKVGAQKIGGLLVDFFSTDSTATPWFLGTGCQVETGIEEEAKENKTVIFPNPFSTETTLRTDDIFKGATLTVYNSLGQQVKQIQNIFGQTSTLSRDNLPSGLYFIWLTQAGKTISVDKLVIKDN